MIEETNEDKQRRLEKLARDRDHQVGSFEPDYDRNKDQVTDKKKRKRLAKQMRRQERRRAS